MEQNRNAHFLYREAVRAPCTTPMLKNTLVNEFKPLWMRGEMPEAMHATQNNQEVAFAIGRK